MTLNLRQKFQGALLGAFVGDALGMPVEGWPPERIREEFGALREMQEARLGAGTYTDDTQMMIAMGESLLACRGFDGEDMARRFVESYDPQRGYGGGTVQVLRQLQSGVSWQAASKTVFEGGSFGNGAAMRIAPIGLFYYDDPYALREAAYESSHITHAHRLGKESAALQAFAIARALLVDAEQGVEPQAFFDDLQAFVEPEVETVMQQMRTVEDLLMTELTVEKITERIGNDVRAFVAVPAAVCAFLARPHSFEEAVVFAVSLGGDTDTIGAMAGAIAGACHGMSGIPSRWLNALENGPKGRDYVIELGAKLYQLKG